MPRQDPRPTKNNPAAAATLTREDTIRLAKYKLATLDLVQVQNGQNRQNAVFVHGTGLVRIVWIGVLNVTVCSAHRILDRGVHVYPA